MARVKTNYVVLDPGSGKARPGAWVTYYLANTLTKASLYADDDVSPVSNPVQANGLGQVAVRVNPGLYDISMTFDGAQPTVVEDVLAWTPETALISEPGDLIVGDATGAPSRLAVGTEGQTLLVDPVTGLPGWSMIGLGHGGLPDGSPGSVMIVGSAHELVLLPPGLQDQALAMAGGMPEWVSTLLPPGTTLPISQPGDLVTGAVTTGAVARLPRGQTDDILKVASTGGLVWGRTDTLGPAGGQCFLNPDAGGLTLLPWKGNQIWIDGRARTIPNEGSAPLTTAGISAATTYYIYAAWVSNAIKVEASTTGYTFTGGLTHKVGDVSRTLVGMGRLIDGGAWGSTEQQRFLLNFFSRSFGTATRWFTAPRSLASPTPVPTELHAEIRVEFLAWDFQPILGSISGQSLASAAGITYSTTMMLDSSVPLTGVTLTSATVNEWNNFASTTVGMVTEGYHYMTMHAATSGTAGAVTWHGESNGVYATRLHVMVIGER